MAGTVCRLFSSSPHRSASRLTRLGFESFVLAPRIRDSLIIAIATHCPLLTDLFLSPSECPIEGDEELLSDASFGALAAGCPQLSSLHFDDGEILYSSSLLLESLLTHCTSLTHLHLPDIVDASLLPYTTDGMPSVDVTGVNSVLVNHPHITHLTFDAESLTRECRPYYSPTITTIIINASSLTGMLTVYKHVQQNPALTDLTVRTREAGIISCEHLARIKRKYTSITRLVWERLEYKGVWKSEAKYVSGGGDPQTFRLFF